MLQQVADILEIAKAELGYLEKRSNSQLDDKTANAGSGNYTKFWRDLYPAFQGQPWCACFSSWCARKAGISEEIIPTYYDCNQVAAYYKNLKRFDKNPQIGDLILFGEGTRYKHIGIIYDIQGSTVKTYEGNTSGGTQYIANGGAVCAKSYAKTYSGIQGYCHPAYLQEEEMTEERVIELINQTLANMSNKPESDWSKQEGWLAKAKAKIGVNGKNITDGTAPQSYTTREQLFAVLGRLGLIK